MTEQEQLIEQLEADKTAHTAAKMKEMRARAEINKTLDKLATVISPLVVGDVISYETLQTGRYTGDGYHMRALLPDRWVKRRWRVEKIGASLNLAYGYDTAYAEWFDEGDLHHYALLVNVKSDGTTGVTQKKVGGRIGALPELPDRAARSAKLVKVIDGRVTALDYLVPKSLVGGR